MTNNDLKIYYSSLSNPHYIECGCSRWDNDNYNTIIETWMTKSELQTLREHITPGAAGELYSILGKPRYYDMTWQGQNTIKLVPNGGSLNYMRNERLLFVKNISDTPLPGPSGWINVKIEGYLSGSGDL